MAQPVPPSKAEVDDVHAQCTEAENDGTTKFRGMTYEQGVKAGIEWMRGETTNPMED